MSCATDPRRGQPLPCCHGAIGQLIASLTCARDDHMGLTLDCIGDLTLLAGLAFPPIWFLSTYLPLHRQLLPFSPSLLPLTTLTTTWNAVHPRPRPHTLQPTLALSSSSASAFSSPSSHSPPSHSLPSLFRCYLASLRAHNLVDDSKELLIASRFAA